MRQGLIEIYWEGDYCDIILLILLIWKGGVLMNSREKKGLDKNYI